MNAHRGCHIQIPAMCVALVVVEGQEETRSYKIVPIKVILPDQVWVTRTRPALENCTDGAPLLGRSSCSAMSQLPLSKFCRPNSSFYDPKTLRIPKHEAIDTDATNRQERFGFE